MDGASFDVFDSIEVIGEVERRIRVLTFDFDVSRAYPDTIFFAGEELIRIIDHWWNWVNTVWFEEEIYCITEVINHVDDLRLIYIRDDETPVQWAAEARESSNSSGDGNGTQNQTPYRLYYRAD